MSGRAWRPGLAIALWACIGGQALGQQPAPRAAAPAETASPAAEPPPAYEPQLLRLAEIIGALAYLRDLCGAHDGDAWRAEMASLLEAEAKSEPRKESLAGAYNRGFRGYGLSYRACTPVAQEVIGRFLDETAKISSDLANRYGG